MILSALLEGPKKTREKAGSKDDTRLLVQAAAIIGNKYFAKQLNSRSKRAGKTDITVHQACAEVARLHHIKGYKFAGNVPKDMDETTINNVDATTRRLKRKLNGNVAAYKKMYRPMMIEDQLYLDSHYEEVAWLRSLCENWCDLYLVKGQNT